MISYRGRPHERLGCSGKTSLVDATSQSVRFARSLATRCEAGQPHLHTCLSAEVSGRETRVHAGRWRAGHSLRLGAHWQLNCYVCKTVAANVRALQRNS
jgi:hypothetical protein